MSLELDNVTREVAENSSVIDSAIVLLQSLSAQIEDLKDDPEALQALADSLDMQSNRLAEAIVANTPSEPSPEPVP